jgi:hypothetical protein
VAHPHTTAPAVAIAPPVRCFYRGNHGCGSVCGQLATHARPGRDWFGTEYFCEQHSVPGDAPIQPEHVFRRVRIFCDVLFAGVSTAAPMSHAEAVGRLEAAVREAGGALDVHEVRSHIVRTVGQLATGPQLAEQGSRD